MNKPDFEKYTDRLVPCIIQHANTHQVLMLGYMNEAAFQKTCAEKVITFYSRSRKALWTKGETSGHYLHWQSWHLDCDQDAILWKVIPVGPVCHLGTVSCFEQEEYAAPSFIHELERIIAQKSTGTAPNSYTYALLSKGVAKAAQKVGEEAVELVIEALRQEDTRFIDEAADLIYHLLVLLKAKGISLQQIEQILQARHHHRQNS